MLISSVISVKHHDACLVIRDSCHCRGEVRFLPFQVKSKGKVIPLDNRGLADGVISFCPTPAVALAAAERTVGVMYPVLSWDLNASQSFLFFRLPPK